MFIDFNAKYVQCLSYEDKLIEKVVFGRSRLNSSVFEKNINLILMHFIHETLRFEEFLHKIALFFKKLIFPDFRLIELVARLIKIVIKNFGLNLPDSISIRSMLDRLKLKIF